MPVGAFSRFVEAVRSFPLFAKAGIGLTVATLAFGVFYFVINSPSEKSKEVAANKSVESKPFITPNAKPSDIKAGVVAINRDEPSPKDIRNVPHAAPTLSCRCKIKLSPTNSPPVGNGHDEQGCDQIGSDFELGSRRKR